MPMLCQLPACSRCDLEADMNETSLLDLPDELLKLIVAGSTGQGVAALSCCCKRLRAVAKQLQGSPIMCSAMSTHHDLHAAIKDATHRAMAGSWGVADFALIFVANYGLPKKYTDPGDASHAVDMLREVLGKDIPIVGCACSGIMGVGPDSKPLEVDPAMSQRRRKPFGRSSSSRATVPMRGVTVLLGKVSPGCAVRAFASAEEPPVADAAWPEFEEALSLTSSQRTQLAAELAAAAAGMTTCSKDDGSASPATAAAATSLLAVAAGEASSSAAAGSSAAAAAAAGASYHTGYGDVRAELVPQLCLLLYRSSQQGSDALGSTVEWMKAHHAGMSVVGGASSGAGDLLFSAGAVNRLASDPPASPGFIGLLVCSATSQQGLTPSSEAPTAAAASAAASTEAAAAAPGCVRSSEATLPIACFSAFGLSPAPACGVFADLSAAVVQMDGGFHLITITAATAVPGTAAAGKPATDSKEAAPAGSSDADAAAGASSSSGAALPERRSQRLLQQQQQQQPAAAAADAPAGDQPSVSGLQQLVQSMASEGMFDMLHDGELSVALWRCAAGDVPIPFTGTEDQVLVLNAVAFKSEGPTDDSFVVKMIAHREFQGAWGSLPGATETDPGVLQHSVWQQRPGTKLCMQMLVNSGEGSALAISRGLARTQQELRPAPAAPVVAASLMADCHAAAAANAKEAGARRGLCGQAVFSCTGRGQSLYNEQQADAYFELEDDELIELHIDCEAALVDAGWQQGCPFVGVYCDGELGPPVEHGCLGWAQQGVSSMPNAFTSVFAAFGFRSA